MSGQAADPPALRLLFSGDDPIPAWLAWRRKLTTIREVSRALSGRSLSQTEFIGRISAIQENGARSPDLGVKTLSLWRMENLAASLLKRARPGNTLNDPCLRAQIRPIAHCGMGIAAVEVARFDPGGIAQIIESFSHPDYRLFAYEGSGAMLALYEPDWFGLAARSWGLIGLIPLAPLRRPPGEEFVLSFPREVRSLMAHGYGRMLYFKSNSILSAIRGAAQIRWIELLPAVQGIAFAYAMVNSRDLDLVLQAGASLAEPAIRQAFEKGLVYSLMFWEWASPGFLGSLRPVSARGAALVRLAEREVASSRRRGALAAFVVEEPLDGQH